MPGGGGLRERKKRATREQIVSAAARLFAEHGYEQVSVGDVARAADVAAQTVYNYFPTKGELVTDQDEIIRARLSTLIRDRPPQMSPVAAIRPFVLAAVAGIADLPAGGLRGEIGHLALISPTVHRLSLEMTDRQAVVIADAILESGRLAPAVARLQAIALASVFQIMFAECGRRARAGQPEREVAVELTVVMNGVFDELERWFATTPSLG